MSVEDEVPNDFFLTLDLTSLAVWWEQLLYPPGK